MHIFEIIIISIGLAMDSCTVSICTGMAMKKINIKKALVISFWFGLFQASMPIIGYFLGTTFSNLIDQVDHFIAFFILLVIGIGMIKENKETSIISDNLTLKNIIVLAIATSIDALAIGITFSFFKTNIKSAFFCIGIITFILSLIGNISGSVLVNKILSKNKVDKSISSIGGIILISIGTKILLEHLGIL